jgi:hypothetical protein
LHFVVFFKICQFQNMEANNLLRDGRISFGALGRVMGMDPNALLAIVQNSLNTVLQLEHEGGIENVDMQQAGENPEDQQQAEDDDEEQVSC